jgi:hypothetical protein
MRVTPITEDPQRNSTTLRAPFANHKEETSPVASNHDTPLRRRLRKRGYAARQAFLDALIESPLQLKSRHVFALRVLSIVEHCTAEEFADWSHMSVRLARRTMAELVLPAWPERALVWSDPNGVYRLRMGEVN